MHSTVTHSKILVYCTQNKRPILAIGYNTLHIALINKPITVKHSKWGVYNLQTEQM